MSDTSHSAGQSHRHISPVSAYVAIWAALMVGTVVTIAVAFVDLGPVNTPLALLIATVKASLVALFFMHLYHDEKFNLVIFISSFLFVLIFFSFTLVDTTLRGWVDPIEARAIQAELPRASTLLIEDAPAGTEAEHGADEASEAQATHEGELAVEAH